MYGRKDLVSSQYTVFVISIDWPIIFLVYGLLTSPANISIKKDMDSTHSRWFTVDAVFTYWLGIALYGYV